MPGSNKRKRWQQVERDAAKKQGCLERKERDRDAARTEAQSRVNQAVISERKPKAKKAREAEVMKEKKLGRR